MNLNALRVACSLALAVAVLPARAAEPADTTTVRLINLLVEQGVLTREKADALLKEASAAPAPPTPAPPPVRVPYVPEFVRKEIKDELRTEMAAQAMREGWAGPGAVPEWTRGLKWDGDLRARWQRDALAADNAPIAFNVAETNRSRTYTFANTAEDRTRLRVRARLGLAATLDDNWAAGVRLTTGSTTDPLSSNQTLGNYGNRYTVAFDRANIRYRYGTDFSAVAGRFGNPWFGTDLVWANDLGFDGVVVQWTPVLSANARGFITVGVLPVQEVELSSADKWLFGAQVGAESGALFGSVSGKVGLAYYKYTHIVGQTSPSTNPTQNEFTAPQFAQKGNTYYNISSDPANKPLFGLASDFRLIDITGALDVPAFGGKHVIVTADFVKNIGYDRAAVSARVGTDVEPKTLGYLARVAFGDREIARRGEWQGFVGYKHVERDAVPDAFTDSDMRLGGTDTKGYVLGGTLGLGRNTAATLRLLSGNTISGAPLSVDVLQLDLTVRF